MEKREASCTVGGNVNWCSSYGKQYGGLSKKIKTKLPYDPAILHLYIFTKKTKTLTQKGICGGPSRWRRSKMGRSPSSPQIHQKYIYMWNNSYRTPIECWQKTSDFPKVNKLPTYLGRAKAKRKNRDKGIGTELHFWEGAVRAEKFPHTRKPLH